MSDDKNRLLTELSQRLGLSQSDMFRSARNGDLDGLLKNADKAQSKQIEEILKDPEKTRQLLSSPQAQALIKLFGNK